MSVLFYTHPVALRHDAGPGHPESPVRLQAILKAVDGAAIAGLERREAPEATLEQVQRVHPARYTSRMLGGGAAGGVCAARCRHGARPGSGEAALRAAGAPVAAVDAVMAGRPATPSARAAPRPPRRAERGDGLLPVQQRRDRRPRPASTAVRRPDLRFRRAPRQRHQDDLRDDPRHPIVSTHQLPLYPGTGAAARPASGNIVNRPLPPGERRDAWRRVVERDVLPAIDAFAPELVLISAGFDATSRDPLASSSLVEADFAWVTRELCGLADRHAAGPRRLACSRAAMI